MSDGHFHFYKTRWWAQGWKSVFWNLQSNHCVMGIDQHPNHTTGDVFKIFFVPWSGKKPYLLQLLTASYQHLCRMEFKIWASDVFICALQVWGEPGTGWPFSTFCRIKHIWASKNLPGMNRFKWSQNGMLQHIAGGGSLISHELCFQATILHWQNEAGRHSFKCLYACVFLCSQLLVFHGADDHAARTYNVTPKRT